MGDSYDQATMGWVHREKSSAIAFIVLACLFPTLLVLTRKLKNPNVPKWGWDEILIFPGMLAVVALCALNIVDSEAYSKLLDNSTPYETQVATYIRQQKAAYTFGIIYPIATALSKLSLCALYLRIFTAQAHCSRRSAILRATAYTVIVFLVANAIAFIVPSAAICNPPALLWAMPPLSDVQLKAHCLDMAVLGTWINLPQVVSDIAILVMPLPMVWGLQTKGSKRIELTLVFLTGGLGVLGASARFALYLHRHYGAGAASLSISITELTVLENTMSAVEPSMYLIAACLPAILGFASRQSYDRLLVTFGSLKQSLRSKKGKSSGQGSGSSSSGSGVAPSRSAGSDEDLFAKDENCIVEVHVSGGA